MVRRTAINVLYGAPEITLIGAEHFPGPNLIADFLHQDLVYLIRCEPDTQFGRNIDNTRAARNEVGFGDDRIRAYFLAFTHKHFTRYREAPHLS